MITYARTLLVVPLILAFATGPVSGQVPAVEEGQVLPEAPARYDVDRPSADFHRGRRAAVLEALPDDAVAIVFSSPTRRRSNDVDFEYRQSSYLYYLTGMNEPATVLVLVPGGAVVDGRDVREVLLVPERDPSREAWDGRRLGAERAVTDLGMEVAVGTGRFEEIVAPLLETRRAYLLPWPDGLSPGSELGEQVTYVGDRVPTLNLAPGRAGFVQRRMLEVEDQVAYERLRGMLERMGDPASMGDADGANVASAFLEAGNAEAWRAWKDENLAGFADQTTLRAILDRMREIKSEEELEFLQRAIDITTAAHREAFRSIEPGLHEYEIEAVIEYVFHSRGAEYTGFPSIVGSGENSVILHYGSNRRRMEDGDLVVMDIGAEYRGYSADVTRTVPVSGRFTREQKLIYDAVLEAQEAAIAASVPGASFQDLNAAAAGVLADHLVSLGLISNTREVQRFFFHGVSHYLGLDVHDAGTYGPLQPGNVITIEPGLYIPATPGLDEVWWNIGVRIEDDVLITRTGPVVLSTAAPRTSTEIEQLMTETGLTSVTVGE